MRINHPSEREIAGRFPSWESSGVSRIEFGTRCYIFGIGESTSTSKQSQTTTSATDNALIQSGKGNRYVAPDAINLEGSARLIAPGATEFGNVSGTGNTITIGASGDELEEILNALSQGTVDAVTAATGTLGDVLSKQSSQIGTLAEGVQTDGDSVRDKTLLWLALAVLAVVGLFIWKR